MLIVSNVFFHVWVVSEIKIIALFVRGIGQWMGPVVYVQSNSLMMEWVIIAKVRLNFVILDCSYECS